LSGYRVHELGAAGQGDGLLVSASDTVPTVGLSEGDGPSSFEQALATNRKRNARYQKLGDRG
jgi:hypothetical protein